MNMPVSTWLSSLDVPGKYDLSGLWYISDNHTFLLWGTIFKLFIDIMLNKSMSKVYFPLDVFVWVIQLVKVGVFNLNHHKLAFYVLPHYLRFCLVNTWSVIGTCCF